MKERNTNIIVGGFVLVAFLVLLGMTFLIRGGLGTNNRTFRTAFSAVSGLEVGSPVMVSGMRAGRVVAITGDGPPPKSIIVTMEISPQVPVRTNARVRIVQQGFIGDKRLEIEPGTDDRLVARSGDMLEGVEPFDLEETFREAQTIVTDLRQTVASFRALMTNEDNQAAIAGSLKNLNASLEVVARILAENELTIRSTLQHVEQVTSRSIVVAERADRLMANIDGKVTQLGGDGGALIAELRSSISELRGSVTKLSAAVEEQAVGLGDKAQTLVTNADERLAAIGEELTRTTRALRSVLEKVDRGDGTAGLLINDPTPFRDLEASLSAVRKALMGSPSRFYDVRLDYLPAPPEAPASPAP